MAEHSRARPANRPSRRHELVAAALELFALQPWELVTVSDIVARAGMTPAAFYYHFPSRDELLEEIVANFAESLVTQGETLWASANTADSFVDVVPALVDWLTTEEAAATVFFLTAVGASMTIEDIRQEARNNLIRAAEKAARRVFPTLPRTDTAVAATSTVVVFEVVARSQLSRDETYRTLGPRRFREEVVSLVETVANL